MPNIYIKKKSSWNKGLSFSLETRKKMSEAQILRFSNDKNWIPWNKGKRISEKHRKNIILSLSDKPWTEKRRKAQELRKGKHYSSFGKSKNGEFYPLIIKNGKIYSSNWHEIRRQVYKRDGWICQECGVHCNKKNLIQCHHIDYDTTNNEFSNLITLCASCHMKTNWKREDWQNHYKKIIGVRGLLISEN